MCVKRIFRKLFKQKVETSIEKPSIRYKQIDKPNIQNIEITKVKINKITLNK